MDYQERQRLAEVWKQQHPGEKCPHDHTTKERILGADTGDRICLDCGEVLAPGERTDKA